MPKKLLNKVFFNTSANDVDTLLERLEMIVNHTTHGSLSPREKIDYDQIVIRYITKLNRSLLNEKEKLLKAAKVLSQSLDHLNQQQQRLQSLVKQSGIKSAIRNSEAEKYKLTEQEINNYLQRIKKEGWAKATKGLHSNVISQLMAKQQNNRRS